MTDDVIAEMLTTWYGDNGWKDLPGARGDMKAAARVLLENMQKWERDNYGAGFDETAMAVGFARSIDVDLTATASPAQEGSANNT